MTTFLRRLFSSRSTDFDELAGLRRAVIAMGLNPGKLAELGRQSIGDLKRTLVLKSFSSNHECFEQHGYSQDESEQLQEMASSLRLAAEDHATPGLAFDAETHEELSRLWSKSTRSSIAKLFTEAHSNGRSV